MSYCICGNEENVSTDENGEQIGPLCKPFLKGPLLYAYEAWIVIRDEWGKHCGGISSDIAFGRTLEQRIMKSGPANHLYMHPNEHGGSTYYSPVGLCAACQHQHNGAEDVCVAPVAANLRCRYADCPEQHPVAARIEGSSECERITCPVCRADLSLPPLALDEIDTCPCDTYMPPFGTTPTMEVDCGVWFYADHAQPYWIFDTEVETTGMEFGDPVPYSLGREEFLTELGNQLDNAAHHAWMNDYAQCKTCGNHYYFPNGPCCEDGEEQEEPA
jgi:hypothetical protein